VLVVSHNRYLLDRVVDRIFELENMRLTEYEGTYSQYRLERLRKLVAQQRTTPPTRSGSPAGSAGRPVRRDRPRTSRSRVGQEAALAHDPAREGAGTRVEKPVIPTARISLGADVEQTRADIALQVNSYTKGFEGRPSSATPASSSRAASAWRWWARTAAARPPSSASSGEGRWEDRTLRVGPSLSIGYCAQHQETFDPSRTILDEFLSSGRTRAGRSLQPWRGSSSRGRPDKRIGDLSGGEKNRLQLARIMMRKANFLVLDEPTNHMDIVSCEAIEESLAAFPGTILVVSHDRYFLDKIATTIVQIEDCGFRRYTDPSPSSGAARAVLAREGQVLTRSRQWERRGAKAVRRHGAETHRRTRAPDNGAGGREARLETDITAAFSRGTTRKAAAREPAFVGLADAEGALREWERRRVTRSPWPRLSGGTPRCSRRTG